MCGFRFASFKTGLIAVAGLLLTCGAAKAARPLVRLGGVRYGGVAVGRYGGFGYVRPGYYGGYGRGLGYGGYGLGYGYGGYGLGLGTGLGLGLGLGYGLGGYGGYGYGGYGLGGYGGYGSGYGGYGLGSGVYGYGAPASGYGGYSSGYPTGNGAYGVPPYGAANPYAPGSQPVNPEANYPPPQQPAPQQQVPQQQVPQEPPPVQRNENTAEVTVVVPEGAELWFNGAKTSQPGTQRKFVTPALTPGEDFTYALKARWIQDGRPVEQTRSIHVQANSSQVIDFTK